MTEHDLKIWPEYFSQMIQGRRWELRRNDRDYKTGDMIVLRKWSPEVKKYEDGTLRYKVTAVVDLQEFFHEMGDGACVVNGEAYDNDWVVLSLTACDDKGNDLDPVVQVIAPRGVQVHVEHPDGT